jgi:hypothetical protein
VAVVAGGIALAGCGGPSEKERAAALRSWAVKADTACGEARNAIAGRGAATNLRSLDRVAAAAADDLRGALAAIERIPAPEGGEDRVRRVLGAMRAVAPHVDALTRAGGDRDLDDLTAEAKRLRARFEALERPARAAGLRGCGGPGDGRALADAVLAPVFVQELNGFGRTFVRRVERERRRAPLDTRARLSDYLSRFSALIAEMGGRFEKLSPPSLAEPAGSVYASVLVEAAGLAATSAGEVEDRFTPAVNRRILRRFTRMERVERRAFKDLIAAVGAAAGPPAPDPDTPEGEEAA